MCLDVGNATTFSDLITFILFIFIQRSQCFGIFTDPMVSRHHEICKDPEAMNRSVKSSKR